MFSKPKKKGKPTKLINFQNNKNYQFRQNINFLFKQNSQSSSIKISKNTTFFSKSKILKFGTL